MVGDGDAVGVGTEIAQYVFWATEGRLRIDDPVFSKQYPEPGCENLWFGEWGELAVELKSGIAESSLECSDKLSAEDTAEYLDGKKERLVG